MSRKRQDEVLFPGVSVEGGFISGDALQDLDVSGRISAKSTRAGTTDDFLAATSFDLIPPDTLEGVCQRSFDALKARWQYFSANGGPVVHLWLSPLLHELHYGSPTAVTLRLPGNEGKEYQFSGLHGAVPLLLVDYNQDLDKPFRGKATPHGLVQEFLNKSKDHLFGIVSNGRELRLLRDNARLTRPAYIGFDLEGIFGGNEYASFALMYRLLHSSRLKARGGHRPEDCLLEGWLKKAGERSSRAMEHLREGVRKAIEALGKGFLIDPDIATALREKQLTPKAFNHELLRLVYRFLFLLVAEERDLLFPAGTAESKRQIYLDGYSVSRLRQLAQRSRGGSHHDLYESIKLVFRALVDTKSAGLLGLTPLGGLFKPKSTDKLHTARLTNEYLLQAMRNLTLREVDGQLRPVDFLRLGTEELGSVYEQLLELEPFIDLGNPSQPVFEITSVGGNDRKATGSYYTPDSLVQCLLDSALEPVMSQAVAGKSGEEAVQALLKLSVCDPACGSGHFLVSAGRRLALRVAEYQAGGELPSAGQVRHAFRQVAAHCLYGVDINDMAIELAKIALWMEAMEPGKPLSFLDHHFRVGNSLLGVTPRLLEEGLPDETFTPISGDDRTYCTSLKRKNKDERDKGVREFQFGSTLGDMNQTLANLDMGEDETLEQVVAKENQFKSLETEGEYRTGGRLLADAWCAAFFWNKMALNDDSIPPCPTTGILGEIRQNPYSLSLSIYQEIRRLAQHYKFFHWHLEFPRIFRRVAKGITADNPQTGWSGGFDCVLGNPPWETMSPDAKEFFSTYDPSVRFQDRDGQKKIIDSLLENPNISSSWGRYCRDLYASVHFIKQSGRFQLFAPGNLGKGDFNVYRMFVEAALTLAKPNCWAAQFVPEGLYNGANCMAIRKALFEECTLHCIYGFENANEIWFKGIDTRAKFCMYAAKTNGSTDSFHAGFNVRSLESLAELNSGRSLNIPVSMVREFSPDALAIMELGSQMDIDISAKMYRWPAFGDETAGPPCRIYMREIDMGNDRELFDENPSGIPLYEGRMVGQFDHRAKGYNEGRGRAADWIDYTFENPSKSIKPQWFIPRDRLPEKCIERMKTFRIGFCDVASPTNERSLVASIIPPNVICGDKVPTILFEEKDSDWSLLYWLALANSYCMDFICRKKISLKMSYTVLDSLPFPRLEKNDPCVTQLVFRAIKLTCTSQEMNSFWVKCSASGMPFPSQFSAKVPGESNDELRLLLRAEIDAIVARDLFQIEKEEIDYILSTFPTQEKYQKEQYGEFRSRRLILEAYDSLPKFSPMV